jgi:thioredoxin reductase (NADPH)
MPQPLDCLIVGAGPAGLVAATYLARFHRDIAVVDAGNSRAQWIPTSHNCPGFPLGIGGESLLQRLRAQAAQYDIEPVAGKVESLQREGALFVARDGAGRAWRARCVILATGVVDLMPAVEGGQPALERAVEAGVLRLCAVCDGYEASDEAIGVLAPPQEALEHGLFLRSFSPRVDAISAGPGEADTSTRRDAERAGITLLPVPAAIACDDGACTVRFDDGDSRRYDTLYPVLGSEAQSQLAQALGADVDAAGALCTDAHQQTSIEGLYAIGDVVSALDQIAVAVGHAAIAATAIHNRLPRNLRTLTPV